GSTLAPGAGSERSNLPLGPGAAPDLDARARRALHSTPLHVLVRHFSVVQGSPAPSATPCPRRARTSGRAAGPAPDGVSAGLLWPSVARERREGIRTATPREGGHGRQRYECTPVPPPPPSPRPPSTPPDPA